MGPFVYSNNGKNIFGWENRKESRPTLIVDT